MQGKKRKKDAKRRSWVYLHPPSSYNMSGCKRCGNPNVFWSEYENHLWCFKCKLDFIPKSPGIFGSPIPISAAYILGYNFDRYNFQKRRVERFDINHGKYI